MSTRVVFLGTPGTAVPALQLLARNHEIGLVVTRPDRPRGRSGQPQASPVKSAAVELGLTVGQPATRGELADLLSANGPFDVGVVVAFGMILDEAALATPAHGMVNAHFSLLPRWRGAAPVTRALMAGDTMTGVTLIVLDEGVDTGPVLTAQAVDIAPEETAGELSERLAGVGARLLDAVLPVYVSGEIQPVPQSDEGAIYAAKLEADERRLSPGMTAGESVDRVRALSPRPGATVVLDEVAHKVLRARRHADRPGAGTWVLAGDVPVLGFADGGVELVEIQAPGRTAMPGADWARGRRARSGQFE